jgi:hypothetical protein
MMMTRHAIRALVLGAGLALLTVGSALAQAPNFTKYVALGDSYGAGYSADCLVQRNQQFSYPATLARQLGIADFQQPTVSDPGIPTCNGLKTLVPSVTFGPISTKTGTPTNLTLARPYDNLSVPGFKIADVSDTSVDNTGRTAAPIVLRSLGPALNQALSLNPTFITLGILGQDILPAAGAALFLDGATVTPLATYTAKYNAVAAALKAAGRTGVFIGTPDLRLIPLLTTIKPVVTNATGTPVLVNGQTVPLLGPGNAANPCPAGQAACPLPAGTFVTLGANAPQALLGGKSLLALGFGIPCAVAALPQCGKPLPVGTFTPPATVNVGVVVYPDVFAQIDKRVQDYNAVIRAAADANGFKYLDGYALSQDLIANGRTFGGIHISNAFVTGGMFAYGNAVHMSNIGYTILADELIQFINTAYGTSVPRPDFSVVLFTPDVPAPGTTGIGATVDSSIFFTETTWRAFFEEFPLQDASMRLAFPAETDLPDRAPVVLPGRRSARD